MPHLGGLTGAEQLPVALSSQPPEDQSSGIGEVDKSPLTLLGTL